MASRRAAQRATTRRLLLDAAMERFIAGGYATTTIDEIASAAGTTRVTFYAYFPSKSEVIKALIAECLDDERARLRTAEGGSGLVDAVTSGSREQLGAWIRETASRWPILRPIIEVGRAAQAVDPDLAHIIDAWLDEAIDDISAGLTEADRFDPDSRRFRGSMAMAQFDYVFQHWTGGAWGIDQDRMCELLTESWFHLLGE